MLAMPLVGPIVAKGLTLEQFQKQLVTKLNANAVRSPNVTLQISEYRPFFILGEVKNPGSYPYVPDMTVLTAVAIAGGFTFRASEDEVSVTRRTPAGAMREARAMRSARILPGDTVYVFERHF
jgi:polysaccharide export outer membrane protein